MDNIFDLEEAAARETTAAPTYNNIAGLMPGYAWLEQLNPEQKQAVETTEGPVLVLSGAGTGKTKVLTTRLAYILATGKAQPWNCLVVTFTNRAAREMKERVQKMIGDVANSVWLGTFHSVCVKILRNHAELVGLHSNFTILSEDDQKRVIKQISEAEGIDDKKYPPQAVLDKISRWKDKGLTIDKIQNEYKENVLTHLYKKYQERLLELNCVDFGDILLYALNILLSNPDVLDKYQSKFKYIMVDEYQDTNVTQYLFLRLLSQKSRNLCCVATTTSRFIPGAAPKSKTFCALKKTLTTPKPSALSAITALRQTFWPQLPASSATTTAAWAKPSKSPKTRRRKTATTPKSRLSVITTAKTKPAMSSTKSTIICATAHSTPTWRFWYAQLFKPANLKKNLLPKPFPIRSSAAQSSMSARKSATPSPISASFCNHTTIWPSSGLSTNPPEASAPKALKNSAGSPFRPNFHVHGS